MPSFGEIMVSIVETMISSIAQTSLSISKKVLVLFQIIASNSSKISPLTLIFAILTFAAVIFFLLKMFRAESKLLITAVLIFMALLAISLVILR